jgi:hypothetical protein
MWLVDVSVIAEAKCAKKNWENAEKYAAASKLIENKPIKNL